jgi:hypothetical protein
VRALLGDASKEGSDARKRRRHRLRPKPKQIFIWSLAHLDPSTRRWSSTPSSLDCPPAATTPRCRCWQVAVHRSDRHGLGGGAPHAGRPPRLWHPHNTSEPEPLAPPPYLNAAARTGPYQALLPCATTEQNLDARHSLDLTPTAPPPCVLSAPPHAAMPPGTVAAAQAAGPHDEAPLDRERPRPHLRRRELGPVSSSDGGKGRGGRRPALWQRLGLDLLCRPSGGGMGGREGTSKYLKL